MNRITDTDVAALFRAGLVEQIRSLGPNIPDVTAEVLAHVDAVPRSDDDATYLSVATAVARAALESALRPFFEAIERRIAASARTAELERQQRELEDFWRRTTTRTIH